MHLLKNILKNVAGFLCLVIFLVGLVKFLEWFDPYFWIALGAVNTFVDVTASYVAIAILWLGASFFVLISSDIEKPWRIALHVILTTLPILILAVWYKVGVPPTRLNPLIWGIDLYDVVCLLFLGGYLFLAIFVLNFAEIHGNLRHWGDFFSLALMNGCFILLPVVWTVADAAHKLGVIHSEPVATSCSISEEVLVMHVSDLHLVPDPPIGQPAGSPLVTRDGNTPGNARLDSLRKAVSKIRPAYLIISGDITDTGRIEEWKFVRPALEQGWTDARVLMAPGNHDLNPFFEHDLRVFDLEDTAAESRDDPSQMPRLTRFLFMQSLAMPFAQTSDGTRLGEIVARTPTKSTMSSFPELVGECLKNCRLATVGERGTVRLGCKLGCGTNWRAMRMRYYSDLRSAFPLTHVDQERGVAFVSMASTISGTDTPGQNAVGSIDKLQIEALERFLDQLPATTNALIVTLHHPLFARGPINIGTLWHVFSKLREALQLLSEGQLHKLRQKIYNSSLFTEIFLANNSAQALGLYRTIKNTVDHRKDLQVFVMFGHRHERSIVNVGGIVLEEAPNLATERKADIGFFALTRGQNAQLQVHWCPI